MVPTWIEPVEGWTDNINGPVGILIAAGKGVLRTMYCKADNYGDFLPVDIAINAVCVATWNYLVNKYEIKFCFPSKMMQFNLLLVKISLSEMSLENFTISRVLPRLKLHGAKLLKTVTGLRLQKYH